MSLKVSPKAVSAIVVAVLVLYVIIANWGGNPFNAKNITTFLVVGIALGGIYAILAGGLVVTYATTGIFNFAHAAIGCFLAFAYWQCSVGWGWPTLVSMVVVLGIVAPAIGIGLDRLIMKRLKDASLVVQLMVTVGLMLAFMGITLTIWKPTTARTLPQFFRDTSGVKIGDVTATWHRIITVLVAIGIAVLLRWLLYRTRLGISMRAVVDSRSLAGLTGAKPSVVSGTSWALGCMTAGLAGILIAPETGLVVENLALLIVVAAAAAAIGQLKSIPWTIAGGLIIGLSKSFAGVFPASTRTGATPRRPFPPSSSSSPCCSCPRPASRPASSRSRSVPSGSPAVGGPGRLGGGLRPHHRLGQRMDPVVRHQLRPTLDVWLGRGAGFMVSGVITCRSSRSSVRPGRSSFANFAIAGGGSVLSGRLRRPERAGPPSASCFVVRCVRRSACSSPLPRYG